MEFNATEKNVVDALDYILHSNGVKVTSKTISERLYLHPDFPSLVSMCDVLTEWKVPNLASRITPNQLLEIPLPAIAFIEDNGGYFAPIRKVSQQSGVEWLDTAKGWQKDDYHTFTQKWNGVSLLLEPNEQSGEANYTQKRIAEFRDRIRLPFLILACIISVFLFILLFPDFFSHAPSVVYGLLALKLLGTCICM